MFFCPFSPFTKNHNHMRYGSWDTEWDSEFSVILGHFFALLPPPHPANNLHNQNFEKMKKVSGDVIILHMRTRNYNHMMYASWDMECNTFFFWSFLAIFCPFTLLTTPKIKIWGKYKIHWEILFFYRSVP